MVKGKGKKEKTKQCFRLSKLYKGICKIKFFEINLNSLVWITKFSYIPSILIFYLNCVYWTTNVYWAITMCQSMRIWQCDGSRKRMCDSQTASDNTTWQGQYRNLMEHKGAFNPALRSGKTFSEVKFKQRSEEWIWWAKQQ